MAAIRPAEETDRDAILSVVASAFASPDHDAREEAQIVLDTWRLGAELAGLEIVAVDEDAIVGHVLGARGHPDSAAVVVVAPLCVTPARQRRGVGSALMQALIAEADRQGWPAVVLLGDPAYYGRFGFEAAGPLGLVYEPVGADSPYFQALRLSAFDPSLRGVFRYCWE